MKEYFIIFFLVSALSCADDQNYQCLQIDNQGRAGSSCVQKEDCDQDLECLDFYGCSYCSKVCDYDNPCPANKNYLCIKLSGDAGNYCFEKCKGIEDTACAQGLKCMAVGESQIYICFPF